MIYIKKFIFLGGRIIKTGIAFFLTALICHSIGWPYMLAVITAIVTIEPTAADSIKKAFIRFPASAIGAAFAMFYTFLLGVTPLTYMLVAVSTIISTAFTCRNTRCHANRSGYADDCARPLFHIVFNSPSDHEYWTAYFFTCEHHCSSS